MEQTKLLAGAINGADQYWGSFKIVADFLMQSDETKKAKELLTTMLPAYYQANPPETFNAMIQKIDRFMMLANDYAKNPKDVELVGQERAVQIVKSTLRGMILDQRLEQLNKDGIEPVLFEMGPGEFWIPIGLKGLGHKFKYGSAFLSPNAAAKAKEILGDYWVEEMPKDGYQIFVACEIIEHLENEFEIPMVMHKAGWSKPNEIHMSTPYGTFGGGLKDWDSKANEALGGHLRTYMPDSFKMSASRLFPGYTWNDYTDPARTNSEIMSLVGIAKNP